MLCLPEVNELDAARITYPPPEWLPVSDAKGSALSFALPFRLPSFAVSLCLDGDGPLLVCGRGGSEAVRVRDMKSLSLLDLLEVVTLSVSGGGVGRGMGCLSCEVEKRLALVNGESVLEFMSVSWGGV